MENAKLAGVLYFVDNHEAIKHITPNYSSMTIIWCDETKQFYQKDMNNMVSPYEHLNKYLHKDHDYEVDYVEGEGPKEHHEHDGHDEDKEQKYIKYTYRMVQCFRDMFEKSGIRFEKDIVDLDPEHKKD